MVPGLKFTRIRQGLRLFFLLGPQYLNFIIHDLALGDLRSCVDLCPNKRSGTRLGRTEWRDAVPLDGSRAWLSLTSSGR